MADNIKIVGDILEVQQISRYSEEDLRLLATQVIKEDFGKQNDYIEYFAYDAGGNLLNINYGYKDFKLPTTSYVDPISGTLPIIEIDPVMDLQNLGYSSGEFKVQYNFLNNKISNPTETGLFLKEISPDRTEIRIGSTVLSNNQIESGSLALISEASSSVYFVDYLINFGNNIQVIAVNTALNKVETGYEILFKLYQPLPPEIQEKSTLWVVKEKVTPYSFNINLDKFIIPAPGPQLRGPNFDIDVPNRNNVGTSYQTYGGLLDSLKTVSSSYQQLLSIITSQSIDINTDYNDFNNFIFFSSAEQRVVNFYNKVKEIEDLKNTLVTYTPLTSSYPNLIADYNLTTASINNTIANFDGFEYYLYFESGSLTSSLEYGITPYPKTNSLKPFPLYPTGSTSSSFWFNNATASAADYDSYNQNNLIYTVPTFIKDDGNNDQYITFLNMIGHYFDNIWIFLSAVTDINLANNNLEQGISKDLVYNTLQSLGTKLYNRYGDSSNTLFLVGNNGSSSFDNDFTPTGSYLNAIPRKDLLAETYKRIYHNLPLLLKTKGTTYGLQTLISTFGITGSILSIKEYGGDLKRNMLDEYNNDKVRIISSSIVTGSVLSPFISLVEQPTSSAQFRRDDLHYVDISFSPETQIDTYASASIVATNPTWSLDDYIGDPRQLYSASYDDLNTQRNTYYNFTASNMDYAGFIRLIQFFDNSLFKMIKDFVPARANLSTGITISSPVLERNKWVYANPSSTDKLEVMDGNLEGPSISTEYTNLYNKLTGSKAAYYTGEFSGSIIRYGNSWIENNFNPYLLPTASLTANDIDVFNHSDYNVLLNNVSESRLSLLRQDIEYFYGTSNSVLTPAYLQDSNESLTTYQRSRYDGAKVTSLLYNTYTSGSYTGSNGSIIQSSIDYNGDYSYGKTAAIDKLVRQLGLFTLIESSSYLPGRNRIALKYLVDEFGGLTELNQRNKHWEDLQRTFLAGDYLNISQFDNQASSNQKTTDGNKIIFNSGYNYSPILYFSSCSVDPIIYFENLGAINFYVATANNFNTSSYFLSGSSNLGFPISESYVVNIFNNAIIHPSFFFTSSLTSPPTYSAQQTENYLINAGFDMNVVIADGQFLTGSLQLFKNGVLYATASQIFGQPVTPSISISPTKSPSITPSVTPSLSIGASTSRTPSITPSTTPSISISKTPSISRTPSISISATPSISISPSRTPSTTPPAASATPSISISRTPSVTPSPSSTSGFTVNIYGRRSTAGTTYLYSGEDDSTMPDALGTLTTGGSLKKTYTGVVTNTIIYVICTNSNVDASTGVVATAAQVGGYSIATTCPGTGYFSFNITANTDIYVYGDILTEC